LRKHLEDNPEARLVDRIDDWKASTGQRVSIGSMWMAVRACGWIHRGSRWFPEAQRAASSAPRANLASRHSRGYDRA